MSDNSQKLSFMSAIHSFARSRITDATQNVAKAMPGHVSKILENDLVEFTFDVVSSFTLPKVKIPQAFSKYSREPTQVGDKGYVVPGDFTLGGESGLGGATADLYPRGNLGTGTYHPISSSSFDKRDPNQFLVTGGPAGHKTQTQDKSTYHLLDALNNIVHNSSSNITHIAALLMSHSATDILHKAISTIKHEAEQITHTALGGGIDLISNMLQKEDGRITGGDINLIMNVAGKAINLTASGGGSNIIQKAAKDIQHIAQEGSMLLSALQNISLSASGAIGLSAPSIGFSAANIGFSGGSGGGSGMGIDSNDKGSFIADTILIEATNTTIEVYPNIKIMIKADGNIFIDPGKDGRVYIGGDGTTGTFTPVMTGMTQGSGGNQPPAGSEVTASYSNKVFVHT